MYIFAVRGLASCRWRQLTSNVRPHHQRPMTFALKTRLVALLAATLPGAAFASGAFVCVANTPAGRLELSGSAGHAAGNLLFPPASTPHLSIGSTQHDLSTAIATTQGAWLVIQTGSRGRELLRYRKTRQAPDFGRSGTHPFCDVSNWMEYCWAAEFRVSLSSGTFVVPQAVCGFS